MGLSAGWKFYGRAEELRTVSQILGRKRWFFAKIVGRRRIGKTSLIQEALKASGSDRRSTFYFQIPDSSPAGVLAAAAEALETFGLIERFPAPSSLLELAKLVASMALEGYVVALDEFQYFSHPKLSEFCSFLQAEVDGLAARASEVPGGLFVLGSIHTEMIAILEDRSAPLYNRTTDDISLDHFDLGSLSELLREHEAYTPEQLLFLWNLFEGVPKFYRDCYEQGVLASPRPGLIKRMFFESSSPLRNEADNWFLKEFRGRYDAILKYIARNAGCSHSDLLAHVRSISRENEEQVGGYLKVLTERFGIIEKRLPIFASEKAKKGRYYVADNFLRAWLGAVSASVAAVNFSPVDGLVELADSKLAVLEGQALEKLVALLYEERSRKKLGSFALSARVKGFWDRAGTEIDLVAISESDRRVRFGNCKRTQDKLMGSLEGFDRHVNTYLDAFPAYRSWKIEKVGISTRLDEGARQRLKERGYAGEDLRELTEGL